MYANEMDNKVILLCKAPSTRNLNVFWTEVQEYIDKGYRFKPSTNRRELPLGMGITRVTLFKVDGERAKVKEDKHQDVSVGETKVKEVKTKETKSKKTATKKSTNTKKG